MEVSLRMIEEAIDGIATTEEADQQFNPEDAIYFEMDNREAGLGYPDDEPFRTWFKEPHNLCLRDYVFAHQNQLCVYIQEIEDGVLNFVVSAGRKWVEKTCPKLLTEYSKFLIQKDEYGDWRGYFGLEPMEWRPEYFGISWYSDEDPTILLDQK